MSNVETIWNALTDCPSDAVVMTIKSKLLRQAGKVFVNSNTSDYEFADHCKIKRREAKYIRKGKIDKITIDLLIKVLVATKTEFTVKVEKSSFSI